VTSTKVLHLPVSILLADLDMLACPEMREDFLVRLSTDERSKAADMTSNKRRRQFVVSRVLAQLTLNAWSGSAPRTWGIVSDERGKPSVSPHLESSLGADLAPRISWSHSQNYVLCAVCGVAELGVDVEMLRPRDAESIAGNYFHEREKEYLRSQRGAEYLRTFYRLWTLKEAYGKAIGIGLSALRDVAFLWDEKQPSVLMSRDHPDGTIQCMSFVPVHDAVAALVLMLPSKDYQPLIQFGVMTGAGEFELRDTSQLPGTLAFR
jgi:phosphopantetheinyl transferase